MLNQRIAVFTALPLRSIDALSLQSKLREIGLDSQGHGSPLMPTLARRLFAEWLWNGVSSGSRRRLRHHGAEASGR
jgi:hypothetical protein